jgi:hypothetical protein
MKDDRYSEQEPSGTQATAGRETFPLRAPQRRLYAAVLIVESLVAVYFRTG